MPYWTSFPTQPSPSLAEGGGGRRGEEGRGGEGGARDGREGGAGGGGTRRKGHQYSLVTKSEDHTQVRPPTPFMGTLFAPEITA